MKKKLVLFVMSTLIFFSSDSNAAEQTSSYIFKQNMHRLFDSYSNAWISISLKNYDVGTIYLNHMIESIDGIRDYKPEKNIDGTKLDTEKFTRNVNQLNNSILELKQAIIKGEEKEMKTLSQKIFNVCVGCHSEVRLTYLFKLPVRRTLFGDYMHKVSEHTDLVRIYMEDGNIKKTEENLKLINYYLDLLEGTFPDKGPSGVVLDKADFNNRLKEVKNINSEMLKSSDQKLTGIDALKKSINDFCVICHEPERIK